ncbi:MAG: serine/threonine-protein kinase, partial [Planctomycetota bacterium]|nr:serine/threonine-protein kinase [Planctomycetota bacterium]
MLDPENLVGQTIGGCQITEKFAIGGMATIYKAVHEATGQVVAVKVLLRDLAADPVYVERFIREVKAAGAVKHPNVTTVLDAGTVENVHYFVMEFVEGAPLDATLAERGQLFWQDAIEIGIQIAGALEQAHAAGIIHRDIKPDNIIVMADGVAKLTDMGISKSLRPDAVGLTAPGIILGTPYYMSPEQAKDSRSV